MTSKHYYTGMAQWHHSDWYRGLSGRVEPLETYAQCFSSVEGNSTFYALPSAAAVHQWRSRVNARFRFCCKVPKEISHELSLTHCSRQLIEFLDRVSLLEENLGLVWLQLSRHFSPAMLDRLESFLSQLPKQFNYAVEVRHLGFFDKSESEKRFNQLLMSKNINRVMFDTRTLFQFPAEDEHSRESYTAKPRVPAHILATSSMPMVRFISPMNWQLADIALDQWAAKVAQWLDEGRTPYLFFHTPSNAHAPQLAEAFSQRLATLRPECDSLQLWQASEQQQALF